MTITRSFITRALSHPTPIDDDRASFDADISLAPLSFLQVRGEIFRNLA